MPPNVAIQPDATIHRNGEKQSYSTRWAELARASGMYVREVNVYRPDWLEQLEGIDAFMWRCGPPLVERQLAKRIVPALEQGGRIIAFPSWRTIWHHEDKIGQYYLLSAAGIPIPPTAVLWDHDSAVEYCSTSRYPIVFKLCSGYQSMFVRLIQTAAEARYWIEQMFGAGLVSMGYGPAGRSRMMLRRARMAVELLSGRHPNAPTPEEELHHGYFYAQAFLPDNDFDTRVTVIGERAFAFKRRNRPGDFRASGSGRVDFSPNEIDQRFVRLAFKVAKTLEVDTVAIDGLYQCNLPVIVETGSAYASWAVSQCPGHWRLEGSWHDGDLCWNEGSMRAEDALFSVFKARLETARENHGTRANPDIHQGNADQLPPPPRDTVALAPPVN